MSLTVSGAGLAQRANDLGRVVDGINDQLAATHDLSADFVQIIEQDLEPTFREEGHVYLRDSGDARWEYDLPTARMFLTDGDIAVEYTPGENLMRRRRVEPGEFDLLPLMSVLGRRNLRDEFERFETLTADPQVEGMRVIRAYPKRESSIEYIVIEADPASFVIRRLLVKSPGQTNDLRFNNVLTNTGLTDALFEFEPPSGTEIVDRVH